MINTNEIASVKEIFGRAGKILVLTGAGVSAESGVPTFRGGGGAPVWRGMPFEELSSARMVAENLPLVWEWFDYRREIVGRCEPNAAHRILARVQTKEIYWDFAIVTQNIDGLHQAGGAAEVVELHGSIWRARCLSCGNRQDLREIAADERPPICRKCKGSMRPDVILFGEAMPLRPVDEARAKAENCDVCLVVGTSALVYPAAGIPLVAKYGGATIIEINPEETELSAEADFSLRGKAGEMLAEIFGRKEQEATSDTG